MYQRDITEYFILPQQAAGNQSNIHIPYQTLCHAINGQLPNGPEKSVAMRKLLESFDAAMRSSKP